MKRNHIRIGSSPVAMLLAVLMVVSSIVVGVPSNSGVSWGSTSINIANDVDETLEGGSVKISEAAMKTQLTENKEVEKSVETNEFFTEDNTAEGIDASESIENSAGATVEKKSKNVPQNSGAGVRRIYFYKNTNGADWSNNIKIHYWGGSSSSSWGDHGDGLPSMDRVDSTNLFYYDIPNDTTTVLFGDGNRNLDGDDNKYKTVNVTLPTDDGSAYAVALRQVYNDDYNGWKNNHKMLCSIARYEIELDSSKTYLLYYKDNNGWSPVYAHMFGDGETTWPGTLMSKVKGYSGLYAVDITGKSYTTVIFNDGTNLGDPDANNKNDNPSSYHKSLDCTISGNSGVYNSNVKQLWKFGDHSSGVDEESHWQMLQRNFSDEFKDVSSGGTVTIYAKTGTIRDGTVETFPDNGNYNATGSYDKYSYLSDITAFTYSDGSAVTTSDLYSYNKNGHSGVRAKQAKVDKNTTVKITVTIKSEYRSKYYIKAFDVNGLSYGVIDQSQADTTKGQYTLTYTTSDFDGEKIEITPIYYYITDDTDGRLDNDSSNFVTFSAEDFAGDVRDAWGGTIACYAYYTVTSDSVTVGGISAKGKHYNTQIDSQLTLDPSGFAALGGYPGQPMVYEGGSYFMQVPKNLYDAAGKSKVATIEGITMNNYIWDDVHHTYMKGVTGDENIQKNHYQTYDYDDFNALMERGATDIIFSFKYRTKFDKNSTSNAGPDHGNKPYNTETLSQTDIQNVKSSGNGWDVLVDYYDYPVDLFANRLSLDQNTIKENSTDSSKNTGTIFVVSDGYVNYYRTANDATERYLGRFATKWYVYKWNGSGFTKIGAMPPSAFLSDCVVNETAGQDITIDNIDTNKFLSHAKESYESTLGDSSNFNTLKNEYVKLYNACKGLPVVITYETEIYSGTGLTSYSHENGADTEKLNYDPAFRSDGRWYYSIPGSEIRANIKIQYKNYGETDYTTDNIEDPHTGTATAANAFFTNKSIDTSGNSLYGQTDVTVIQNKENAFTFRADPYSEGKDEEGETHYYKFVGWYLNTGSNTYPPINYGVNASYVVGQRSMNSYATFVARYEEVKVENVADAAEATKVLVVTHDLYSRANITIDDNPDYDVDLLPPTPHNGDGTPYVKLEILDSADNVLETYNDTYGAITAQSDLLKTSTNKVRVTLTTVTVNTETKLHDVYRRDDESCTYRRFGGETENNRNVSEETKDRLGEISASATKTEGTTSNTYSLTYTYNLEDIFLYSNDGVGKTSLAKIDYFTDLYTQGNIKVNFKYYDRDTSQHSKPTSISTKETTVSVTASPTITKDGETTISLQNAVSNAVYGEHSSITIDGQTTTLNATVMSHLDNVVDNYYFWTSQDVAVAGIKLMKCYRDEAIIKDDDQNFVLDEQGNRTYKTYYETLANTVDYSYHTDAYGKLKNESTTITSYTDADKWVTYTLVGDSTVYALDSENAPSDITLVDSVNVWVYNAPKKYNVKVYNPTFNDNNEIEQTGNAIKTNGDLTYYIPDDPEIKWTFYNQRLGDNDTYGPTSDAGSNNSIDYLNNYGILEPYAGGKIVAPSVSNMVFDGWYALKNDDTYDLDYKITSDLNFGYRVTSNLSIVACYKAESSEGTTINNIPGVSVSSAGVDYYVDQTGENGILKVRENTLLNVYYPGDFVDSDQGIKRYAAIIVKLPVVDSNGDKIDWFGVKEGTTELDKMQSGLRTAIQNHLDQDIGSSGNYRTNEAYPLTGITVEVNKKAGINCFTYDVKWDSEGTASSTQITLTNKNRVMFTFPMKASLYEGGSNAALLSYAAIYYDLTDETNADAHSYTDGETTVSAKWILSDNYVPFIYPNNNGEG